MGKIYSLDDLKRDAYGVSSIQIETRYPLSIMFEAVLPFGTFQIAPYETRFMNETIILGPESSYSEDAMLRGQDIIQYRQFSSFLQCLQGSFLSLRIQECLIKPFEQIMDVYQQAYRDVIVAIGQRHSLESQLQLFSEWILFDGHQVRTGIVDEELPFGENEYLILLG